MSYAKLLDSARQIARAHIPPEEVEFGPWEGSRRSISADLVPRDYLAGGQDFLYRPRSKSWVRRKGQAIKFDTLSGTTEVTGLLPAKWSGKCRHIQEFPSDSFSDTLPSLAALVTKETVTGTDSGRFSNLWVRDQVNSVNYTVGNEFDTAYPVPGSEQQLKFVPLWYDSGEGGITRGPSEFTRRMFFSGSRRFQRVGNWWYFPSFYGTPSRWRGSFTDSTQALDYARPSAASSATNWTPSSGTKLSCIDDTDSDTAGADYVTFSGAGSGATLSVDFDNLTTLPSAPAGTVYIHVTVRSSSGCAARLNVTLAENAGNNVFANRVIGGVSNTDFGGTALFDSGTNITASFVRYTCTLTSGEKSSITWTKQLNLSFVNSGLSAGHDFDIAQVEIQAGSSSITSNRLIPSGPLPPVHAGSLAASTQIENVSGTIRPTSDIPGSHNWIKSTGGGTNLYTMIDEETPSISDDITTPDDNTDTECEVKFNTLGYSPGTDSQVQLKFWARRDSATSAVANLRVRIVTGSTIISTDIYTPATSYGYTFVRTLTAAEIAAINTADSTWADVRVRFNKSTSGGASARARVAWAAIFHTANSDSVVATGGGWRGSDRFYYSVAYRFEDDSIWMPCTPRGPNATLTSGYNMFTVDEGNATAAYQKVTWSNIPIGPYGTKSRILLRSPKIDSSTDSTLQLNPRDLRVVWEIKDNTTTTYDDFFADDDALVPDPDQLLIRDDHIMPPRARYIFSGDSRVCHSYGGLNPAAIILAPVSYASDTTWDRNLVDTSSTLFGATSFNYRVTTTALELYSDNYGTALGTADSYTLASHTLESLVDAINATTISSNAKRWRAQIAPGANPQAAATYLTPTYRTMTVTTTLNDTAATVASGASNLAVGSYIKSTNITAGTYIAAIVSDTAITLSANATGTGAQTATIVASGGDAPTGQTVYDGYVRALGNSLPSFLYFTSTYLDLFPVEKSAVWMTVATPGAVKSAPNCFSGKITNKHTPPLEAGISMGGVAVDNGFVVPMSNKNCVIRNTRDSGTGVDSDYRLFVMNHSRGCCAWNTVTEGNRFAVFFSPEGFIACDLENEILLSEDIYRHPTSDSNTGVGDFSYIAPLVVGSTAADVDTYDMYARIMRGVLWVNYTATSGTHPNRRIAYDFSSGSESSGLGALLRAPGRLWGWSTPLVYGKGGTCMCEGRRSDGGHLYAWNESNGGGTGDGRIDEFEINDTDNSVAISSAAVSTPWLSFGTDYLSGQEVVLEHLSPTGATVSFKFYRSTSSDTYTMTPSVSSSYVVIRDVKMLALGARSPAAKCYLEFLQSAGGAAEIRKMTLRVKRLRITGRGPSYS